MELIYISVGLDLPERGGKCCRNTGEAVDHTDR